MHWTVMFCGKTRYFLEKCPAEIWRSTQRLWPISSAEWNATRHAALTPEIRGTVKHKDGEQETQLASLSQTCWRDRARPTQIIRSTCWCAYPITSLEMLLLCALVDSNHFFFKDKWVYFSSSCALSVLFLCHYLLSFWLSFQSIISYI